jgi:hypothetical protein
MKSAARNVPQPFQVAGNSKLALFEFPATWKGCGTFSEESTEQTEEYESSKFLNCFHVPILLIPLFPFVPYSLFLGGISSRAETQAR